MGNMLKLNGIWLPTPSSFDVDVDDLDEEAFRNADGVLFRARIGKSITAKATWDIIPNTQESYSLFNTLDNMSATGNRLLFPHPNGNNNYEISCYRSAKVTTSMRSYYDEQLGRISKWQSLTVSFIEDNVTKY